jgi:DDE_Tnp_1-associated
MMLSLLARVPDPRKRRGRRFGLVFVLAVAVVAVLAGASNFWRVSHARTKPYRVAQRRYSHPVRG